MFDLKIGKKIREKLSNVMYDLKFYVILRIYQPPYS
jgi:hypothetical protein